MECASRTGTGSRLPDRCRVATSPPRERNNYTLYGSSRMYCAPAEAELNERPRALRGSQLCVAETQRVADDRDGAEAHRGAGDHRTQEQPEERVQDTGRY